MTDDDRLSEPSDEDQSPSATLEGTLVVSTWSESNEEPHFRARVISGESPGGRPITVLAADPEEVLSIVRQWLYRQHGKPDGA